MARSRKIQTSPATLRALTYGRVSTGRQASEGLSLDDQADKLADVVSQRGWTHVEHVTDPGLSGKRLANRKGLLAALDKLDRGEADVLVASKIDRVARNTRDFAGLLDRAEKRGWKIVVLDVEVDTTTAAGRLVVEVVAAAAQFESRRIGERVRDTHAVRRSQGKRAGQPPVLSQEIRQRIYDDHVAGKSLSQTARDLDSEGIPTAKGGKWHPYTVSQVIDSVKLDAELAALADRASSPLE
jgi:DNA invertase Pin-like site-specific DNA recombinase